MPVRRVAADPDDVLPTPTPPIGCPDGYFSYWYTCYRLDVRAQLTWQEAEHACAADNSSLVSVHTAAENSALLLAHAQSNYTQFWIGLHDPDVSRLHIIAHIS